MHFLLYQKLYSETTGQDLREDIYLDDVLGPIDDHTPIMTPQDRFATVRSRDTIISQSSTPGAGKPGF